VYAYFARARASTRSTWKARQQHPDHHPWGGAHTLAGTARSLPADTTSRPHGKRIQPQHRLVKVQYVHQPSACSRYRRLGRIRLTTLLPVAPLVAAERQSVIQDKKLCVCDGPAGAWCAACAQTRTGDFYVVKEGLKAANGSIRGVPGLKDGQKIIPRTVAMDPLVP
jgi:hypothetical protein